MGQIVRSSELSGRKFGFNIAGDEPTIDEQMYIDNILRQQDAQFIEEYKKQFGVSPTDEGEGIANYAGEIFKGLGRGGVGFLESAALGASTLLPEEQELAAREAIRSTAYDLKPQADIGMEDTVGGKFGEALGSFAPLLATSLIPGVGVPLAAGLGAGAGAGEASERAREEGATLEERNLATRLGAGVGLTEILPIKFGKLDKILEGSGVKKRAGRVLQQAGIEGFQELAANTAQNLIEQGYNPDQEFGEGNLEAAGYGAGVGGFVQLVADLLVPRRGRGRKGDDTVTEGEKKAVEDAVEGDEQKVEDEVKEKTQEAQEELILTAEDPYNNLVDDESGFSEEAAFERAAALTAAENAVDAREDAINSIIQEAQIEDGAFLSREEAIEILDQRGLGDAGRIESTTRGDGTSIQGSKLGVDGEGGDGSGDKDSSKSASSDEGGLDTSVSDLELSDVATGEESDTLGQGELDFDQARKDQEELNAEKATLRVQEEQIEEERGSAFSRKEREVIKNFIDTRPEVAPFFNKRASKKAKREALAIRNSLIRDLYGMGVAPGVAISKDPAGIEGVDREQRQDAELDTRTPESTAIPAIPTMEVLDELGVSKGTAAYQIAKNRLADSVANNDRDAILADVSDIFGALRKLKTKDAQLKARVDEYVAKATPKESTPEAKERRDTTRRQRRESIDKLSRKVDKNERQSVQRAAAKAKEQEAAAARIARSQGAVSPEGMEVSEDANREQVVKKFMENRPRASLGQTPKRGLDSRLASDQLFAEFVRKNVKLTTPEGGTRPVENVSELSSKQLADAIAEYEAKQLNDVTDQIITAKFTKEKEAKRAKAKSTEFTAWLKETYSETEINNLYKAANKKELAEVYDNYIQGEKARKEMQYNFGSIDGRLEGTSINHLRLTAEATVGLNLPLDPVTMTMLEDNNLTDALRNYAKSAPNPSIAKMAKALSRLAGTTRVVFADVPGNRVTGAFAPRENTIVFNRNIPVVGHTLMHEMMHAATINEMTNNPNKPAVRQLQKIFDEISDALPSAYGSKNVSEFIAEAFSNPEFQKQLAAIRLTGAKGSLLDQVRRQIARILNFIKGKPNISALGEVEALVDGLLAPAPAYVNADIMYNIANDPADARRATNAALMNGPLFDATEGNKMLAWLEDKTRGGVSDGYNLGKTIALRATPLHYLVDLGKKYFSGGLMDSINNTMNKASGALQESYDSTEAIVGDMVRWSNANPDKVEAFNSLINDSTIYQIDPEMSEAEAVRKYAEDPISLDIHRRLRELFREVGPDGQKQYRQIRNFFRKMRVDLQNALANRLSQAGVPEAVQNRILNDFYTKLTRRGAIEPYFPLTRKGDNWLFFSAVDPNTGVIEYYAESFESEAQRNRAWSEMRGDIIRDMMESEQGQRRMESLRQDAGVNTEGMSPEQVAELATGVTATLTIPNQWYNNAPNTSFINQLMSQLSVAPVAETSAAAEVRQNTMDEVSKLILNTLPETSYVQSFRKRKEGEVAKAALSTRQDAIRTISDRAKSLTRQIVEMEYNAEFNRLNAQLDQELRNRVGKPAGISRAEAAVYKELAWFTRNGVKQKHTDLSRALTGVAFNFTLGFNVSGGLINLSQIPLIVLPMLGGKYGYAKTMKAMGTAMKIMRNGGFSRKIEGVSDAVDADGNPIMEEKTIKSAVSMANYDYNDPNLPTEIQELKELAETGIELGQFKRSLDYEILDIDKMSGFWAKFNKASGFFLHHGERINREVTMIASYKLALDQMSAAERADPMMRKQAAAQAVADAESMNGGLAANATPRLAQNSLGRVIFMYKKYGVTMLSLLHKLSREALAGQSREARRMARFQIAGIYGSAGALAGVAGMPLYGTVAMVHDLFADDDDEEGDDLDSIVRMYLGEGPYRGGVNYLTGVNVATRVGLGEFLFRDTLVKSDMPLLYQYFETVGGPLVGVYLNTERAAKLFGQGEFYRGFEAAAPAAIKNGMKSLRYYNDEGIENVAGDKIIGDIHPAHVAVQAFGFSPAEYSRTLELNADAKGAERAVLTRRSKLLRKYFKAYFDGDQDELNSVAQQMQEYNQDHPQYPITTDTITRSRKKRLSDKEKKYRGITYNSRLRDRYVGYLEDYGDDVSMFF